MALRLEETIQEIPPDDFDLVWAFSQALRCALADATPDEAQAIWGTVERRLSAEPAMPLALSVANALRVRPPPAPQADRMLEALDQHPQCRVRASALFLRHAVGGEPARLTTAAAAQAALRSSCWQLQAAGLRVLRELDIAPEDGGHLASFLRGDAVW
jgi:hypothetical protein